MKITTFNQKIAAIEGGKKNLSIAQISEVSKIINQLTGKEYYKMIKKLPE